MSRETFIELTCTWEGLMYALSVLDSKVFDVYIHCLVYAPLMKAESPQGSNIHEKCGIAMFTGFV